MFVMENTVASFLSAIENGADSIELDVNVSKDGELVIFHDPYFSPRNTLGPDGKPIPEKLNINELTLAEIQRLEMNDLAFLREKENKLAPEDSHAPTLQQLFDAIAKMDHPNAKKVIIDVEIKFEPGWEKYAPPPAAFAKKVLDVIHEHGPEGRVVVRCFDHRLLEEVRKIDPKMPISALIWPKFPRWSFRQMINKWRPAVVSPEVKQVTRALVDRMHRSGIKVMPYTANNPDVWQHLLDVGVDGFTVNNPGEARQWLTSQGYKAPSDKGAIYGCPWSRLGSHKN